MYTDQMLFQHSHLILCQKSDSLCSRFKRKPLDHDGIRLNMIRQFVNSRMDIALRGLYSNILIKNLSKLEMIIINRTDSKDQYHFSSSDSASKNGRPRLSER